MPHYSPEQAKIELRIEESPPPSGSVDLSNYYTKGEVDSALIAATGADLSAYYTKAQIDAIVAAKVAIDVIVDDLNSTDTTKPLSAAQGKALKMLIDNIVTLLGSDDTNLDTLQEIVDFIELNKATLDTLGISNIAGLQNALNAKADAGHSHDGIYAAANHSHQLKTINGQSIEGSGNIEVSGSAQIVNIITSEEYMEPYTIDGKQVYGVRIAFGALPNNTTKSVPIPNFNSLNSYWISEAYAYNPSNKYTIVLPKPGKPSGDTIMCHIVNNNIQVVTFGDWSAYSATITLNYTK